VVEVVDKTLQAWHRHPHGARLRSEEFVSQAWGHSVFAAAMIDIGRMGLVRGEFKRAKGGVPARQQDRKVCRICAHSYLWHVA
jgi:hypothetical protein